MPWLLIIVSTYYGGRNSESLPSSWVHIAQSFVMLCDWSCYHSHSWPAYVNPFDNDSRDVYIESFPNEYISMHVLWIEMALALPAWTLSNFKNYDNQVSIWMLRCRANYSLWILFKLEKLLSPGERSLLETIAKLMKGWPSCLWSVWNLDNRHPAFSVQSLDFPAGVSWPMHL